jgi:hypothetical protein
MSVSANQSNIVNIIDREMNIQHGENNHAEYCWSENNKEKIVQLSFQLVRSSDKEKKTALFNSFKETLKRCNKSERDIMIKMVVHTRDIVSGKGEYDLFYGLMTVISEYDFDLFKTIFNNTVGFFSILEHPYGSWKDVKYMLKYMDDNIEMFENEETIPLVKEYISDCVCEQLKNDVISMKQQKKVSLCSKWIPREGSNKFGIYYFIFASRFFDEWSATNAKAVRKIKTHFRKILSSLNNYIDTVQIKQCSQEWNSIDFDKVTSVTMMKQKQAFMNVKRDGNERYDCDDRRACKHNFQEFIKDVKENKKTINGKRVGIVDFVKNALNVSKSTWEFSREDINMERDIINESWKNNHLQTPGKLRNFIAMVDTSGSMECEKCNPLYSAIGLGIRVAEMSVLGKRVMTFNHKPTWVNLENCNDFVGMVEKVRESPWGTNTNFHMAMDMILDIFIKNKVNAKDVEDLCLVVFSDMQFDNSQGYETNNFKTIIPLLKEKFAEAGKKVCCMPYNMPHIIFWNLRSTNGFPSLSTDENVSMLSGYSPMLLNEFVDKGKDFLEKLVPYTMLSETLNKDRYNIIIHS